MLKFMRPVLDARPGRGIFDLPDAYAAASLTNALSGEAVEGKTLALDAYGYRLLRTEE